MTDAEILSLLAQAQAEFNQNEQAMLVPPLAVIGLVERLQRCEQQRAAAAAYDEVRDHTG